MKKTTLPLALLSALLFSATPSAQAADPLCDPLDLQWTQPSYALGEKVVLHATGTPGTLGFMFVNTDPGPLVVPGLGTFGVGAGPGLQRFRIRPIPAQGYREYSCQLLCQNEAMAGMTFYVQAVTISPLASALCISNLAPLVITDDECVAQGCTPGLWKNKTEKWTGTGYSPSDDFDTVFGVDLFDPDISLLFALQDVGKGAKIFSAHAVAALLNATSPNIAYPLGEVEVIQMVQDAVLADDLEPTKDKFDMLNNSGCPL